MFFISNNKVHILLFFSIFYTYFINMGPLIKSSITKFTK